MQMWNEESKKKLDLTSEIENEKSQVGGQIFIH